MLPLRVHTEDGSYAQGEEFDKEFTADEEATNLASGLLEIVPRTYKVIGGSRVFETAPGDEFQAALTLGQETHLIGAGHIERVAPAKKTTVKKEAK
jgi:hypothetical protein